MKKILMLATVLAGCIAPLFAQTAKVKAYQMYTTNYMMPKHGMEQQFEDGLKAHNAKYHASGPYAARIYQITEGTGSDGWYVWVMGPNMYSDLDKQPQGDKAHDDDWTNNVDKYVEKYGESNFWKLQEDISYTPSNYNPERTDVWSMDIKQGMRYKFADLMKKWKALWEAKKYPFSLRVFYNDLFDSDGKDAAIVYSFTNYSDFDLDLKWREDYEAMYGPGSWDQFWKTWDECVVSTDEHLRKQIK